MTSPRNKTNINSIAKSLLTTDGAVGIYGLTSDFEQVIEGLAAFIGSEREPETEVLRFPPVVSLARLQTSGYLQSFPHLLGCVSCLSGEESEIRSMVERPNWVASLSPTELALSPAACYPIYPLAASRGKIPGKGLKFDVASYCFRREATHEIDRLPAFRMREFVCLGTPEQVLDFRNRWVSRATRMAEQLGLTFHTETASDPFFGREGRLAKLMQLEQSLKIELLVPLRSKRKPTACMSFNYHRDHFGRVWDLHTGKRETAHTACVAFGMERLVLALFATHGRELKKWPRPVRKTLSV